MPEHDNFETRRSAYDIREPPEMISPLSREMPRKDYVSYFMDF